MRNSDATFWIVWCVGGGTPTVPHARRQSAHAEAERLARANPGKDFVVCRAITSFRKADVIETELHGALDEDVPF